MKYQIKSEKKMIDYNGHPLEILVTVSWDYDSLPVAGQDFDFEDAEENRKYERRFESGEFVSAIIQVSAECQRLGVVEADYLGGVHCNALKLEEDILATLKDHDMESLAIDTLKLAISRNVERYSKLSQKGA